MSIITALTSTGYPVVHVPYTGEAATFVTFSMINAEGSIFADGEEQAGEKLFSVDVFTKTEWEPIVAAIKAALKTAGYLIQRIGPEIYEPDTQLYHIPLLVAEDT